MQAGMFVPNKMKISQQFQILNHGDMYYINMHIKIGDNTQKVFW